MNRFRFFVAIISLAALSASSHVYSQTPGAEPPAPGSLVSLKLPSTYKNSQTPTDQLQLNGDRTFSLQEAGQTYRGTFVVNGDTLELSINETNTKTSVTIQGDSLADSSGQTWVLRGQPVGSGPGAELLRNQDVIKMAKADFDDAVIIAKIANSRCQFDTSPSALTQLKQSGVSAAVLKAMAEVVVPQIGQALPDRAAVLHTQGGYIARNPTELEALKRLGERNYFEFTLLREDKQPKRVGDISLKLTSVDKKRNMYTLVVFSDDKMVQKKDKEIYEPLQVYLAKTKQPYVLVVNEIGKDQVTGYLAAPKDASQKAVTPQSTVPEAVANAEVSNPPNAGQGVVHSGTFHIAEEGTWRVIYDLSGSYTVTPTDVLVTLETGSARTVHSVAAAPVLRSLRLEVCYQMSTDSQFDMFPGPFAGQELLLNDVSLKDGEVFKFPSSTFRIPRPTRTPVRNWLCSSLSGQRGNFYPAHDAGRPVLIPSASIGTAEGLLHIEDVIKMVKAGFDDALIIEKVGNSKCQFDTSADAFTQLKQSGASGPVVRAVMEASAPRGLTLTGRVVWNGLPVPNAKVRLAHRDSVSAPASASAVTANNGAFTIQDPPAGDLMIWVYAPSSEYEDLTGHAVTITAGIPTNIGNVSITKKLQLLSPTVSEIATTTPALEWAPFPDSVRYNVYVFNDSTRQRILLRSTKDTRMTVPAPLPNGQHLRWGVQAYNSKGEVIAVSWWRFTIGSGQPNETIAPPAAPPNQTPTVSLRQTIDQIVAILGQPESVVDLGSKKIYVY